MQRFMDVPRMNRLRRTAKILSFGGLGLLVLALVLSLGSSGNLAITLGLALLGLLTSQMGSILMRRWPDRGRADQVFDAALKGLNSRNTLVHYLLGSRHGLLTPAGPIALIPVYEPGFFEIRSGTVWRTKTKRGEPTGKAREARYLVEEAEDQAQGLARDLDRRLSGGPFSVTPVLVFFHPEARVKTKSDAPPAVHVKKLKDYIRSLPRRSSVPPEAMSDLRHALERFRLDS